MNRAEMVIERTAELIAAKMNFIKNYSDDAKKVQNAIDVINNELASMQAVLQNENDELFERDEF